jgi:hypothetical protein
MISVNEIKLYSDYISNKEQSGNTISPDNFNLLLRRGLDDLFKQRYGLPEEYQPGMPLPRMAYEVTQKMKDDLRMLKKTETLSVDANGQMLIPSDYVHYTRITYVYFVNNKENKKPDEKIVGVEVIDDDKWDGRRTHPIKVPNKKKLIIANFNSDNVEYFPKDLGNIQFTYLKYPPTPVWAYTIDADDNVVYDPSNSINIELPAILTNDLTRIILSYIGINLREQGLVSYVEEIKAKGM